MGRMLRFSGFVLALALAISQSAFAQPPEGGPRGGQRGARGAMMAMRFVPIEQVLGFLAFDEKVKLQNDQLLKVRDALKAVHAKRADMVKELGGSTDREAMMGKVRRLRSEMTQSLTAVLKPAQVEVLKKYMQNMNQRSGGRQRPGGQRGGGQRGGE